jgi:hypothetical protein
MSRRKRGAVGRTDAAAAAVAEILQMQSGWGRVETDFNYSPGRLHLHCIALHCKAVASRSPLLFFLYSP